MFKQIFSFLALIASAQAFAPVSQSGAFSLMKRGCESNRWQSDERNFVSGELPSWSIKDQRLGDIMTSQRVVTSPKFLAHTEYQSLYST
jgi:hypothetical protein